MGAPSTARQQRTDRHELQPPQQKILARPGRQRELHGAYAEELSLA
ncbi:MAG: Uncharacterised protein [Cellvibrionales bacterium UBA7375]|nr:MAG: Uncharacterised protein [Cellvibrionales bacterium UBA7375]